MRSFKRQTKLCLTVALLSLSACGSFQVEDIGPMVTLPASGDCYQVTVITHKKKRYPKSECDEIKRRGVILTSEDWRRQRVSILKNCEYAQCTQFVGAFDELFKAVDAGLSKIPVR